MKIIIIVTVFLPKWIGGSEIAAYHLAEQLAQMGHEVHIMTSHDNELPLFSKDDGFYIHRIPWKRIRFIGVLFFWAKIFLQIRNTKPDIVHSQSLSCCTPALISKKILGIPYIAWGRGTDVYIPNGLFDRLSAPSILKNADAVLALTADMKREMQNICERDVIVVPNGVKLKVFQKTSGSKIEDNAKTIIYVGRLQPVKGVQYLIEAMIAVQREIPDINLVIVGDGEERSKLEKLAKELDLTGCIQFVGKVPQEEIPSMLHQSDIFVLPSLSEGFPNVIIEAMAAGLPIVASKIGGIPEIVEDEINGYLVSTKKPDEIADKILVLLQNDDIRVRMANNNVEKAEMYTLTKVADKVEEIYLNVLNKTRLGEFG